MKELHLSSDKALFAHFEANDGPRHARALCRLIRLSNVDVMGAIRGNLFADDWLDFAHTTLAEYFRLAKGELYLAASDDHPGLIKLGKTGQGAATRMRTLNRETVLHPFRLLDSVCVHDRHWIELLSHRTLVAQGVPRLKEFFPADQARLRDCIDAVAQLDRKIFNKQGFGLALPT
jgi:T5orf172 domain